MQAVIATGVQAGERVVTTGFARLTDGTQRHGGERARTPASAAPEPARGRRRAGGTREGRRGEGGSASARTAARARQP